ncbi:MAG: imelysin family protein [Rikenellaceae bacterium]
MRKLNKICAVALSVAALAVVSCESGDDSNVTDTYTTTEQDAFMSVYVDDVIMARYSELATAGKTLLTAVEAIQSSTESDKTSLIATAAEAWVAARISWERTEAYLFGPVDMAGIDPGIDSWPLVLPDLQTSIQAWDTETDSYLSLKTDGGDLKGFHAIEYMLFADGSAKEVTIATFDSEYEISQGSLSDEGFEAKLESYAVAVCTELYRCVLQLEAEWDLSGLSSSKLTDYNAFGSNITMLFSEGNYAEIFKNPGLDNAYYSSFNVCLFAAFDGAIGITDEVANTKIADPIDAETESAGSGLLEVESWFSHNSISDFTNNMRGVKEAYMGTLCTDETSFDALTTPATGSLGALVAAKDATIGAEVVSTINAALEAIKDMPSPFRDNLLNEANKTAQDAINAAAEALEAANAIIEE